MFFAATISFYEFRYKKLGRYRKRLYFPLTNDNQHEAKPSIEFALYIWIMLGNSFCLLSKSWY